MPGPVLLAIFDRHAKAAQESGDNRPYVEQTLAFFDVKRFARHLTGKIFRRLLAAEDRYRDNQPPFLTEHNVAAAFNALRSSLNDSEDYPVVKPESVRKLHRWCASYTPHLFQPGKSGYSPTGALILLDIIATNNGNLDGENLKPDPTAEVRSSGCVMLIKRSGKQKSFFDSLKSQPKGIFQSGIKKRIQLVLQHLGI
jgi:hypothetical protein